MKTLDLHGLGHDCVETKVINFVLMNDLPLKIITGDSSMMRELVFKVLEEYNFDYRPEHNLNYGAFIIRDKTK
jgi:hypothetical protein|tara:strand:+ start:4743 stop:4961 length:219 start_codon:yes stop_codon:yes gene_type:complete